MPVDVSVRLADGDHVVQFYDHDDDLVGMVGGFLAAAVRDGDMVVVVATPAHRDGFAVALVGAGVDIVAAQADGRLTMLDATETLDRIMVGGSPDDDRFATVIGGLVGARMAKGRQVRVYGEMVALLWEAGNVTGAIELERLWNGLGAEVPFSLFCAYPTHLMSGPDDAHAFEEVCHLHSSVVGDAKSPVVAEVTRDFRADPDAPRLARSFVSETLRSWDQGHVVDAAVLVVSELATNAVVHVGRGFTVRLSNDGSTVRIGVADSSRDAPTPRHSGSATPGGHGLHLVDAIAHRCGYDTVDDGKVVWAELTMR
jgi:anti-sigma regulatory factor (Ser/Thr protein kinase)